MLDWVETALRYPPVATVEQEELVHLVQSAFVQRVSLYCGLHVFDKLKPSISMKGTLYLGRRGVEYRPIIDVSCPECKRAYGEACTRTKTKDPETEG